MPRMISEKTTCEILDVLQSVASLSVGDDLGPARRKIEAMIVAEREGCATTLELAYREAFDNAQQISVADAAALIRNRGNQ